MPEDYIAEGSVALSQNQIHYLRNVMRLESGVLITLFNGKDGEWLGVLEGLSKKNGSVILKERIKRQVDVFDISLVFAPLKKARMDMVIEKSTELGIAKFIPVTTDYTQNSRLKEDRIQAQIIEAAEQCERLDIPNLEKIQPLKDLLKNWPENRILFVCGERGVAEPVAKAFGNIQGRPVSFLVGPEGGFSNAEIEILKQCAFVKMISLGARILRAETAVCAVLSCYQAIAGDWRSERVD